MSMAMALNNVKKCYSKVPNSCPVSNGGALGLDTMGSKSFLNINFTKHFPFNLHNVLDFVELTCIFLGILTSKKMAPIYVISFLVRIPNKNNVSNGHIRKLFKFHEQNSKS